MLPDQSASFELTEVGPTPRLLAPSLRTLSEKDQYSQREDASTLVPSPISVPPWSPRRYLLLEHLMAIRPCSRNSRKKSSGFSPSEHTRPLLETYQNFPFTPVEGYQWIIFLPVVHFKAGYRHTDMQTFNTKCDQQFPRL